MTFSRSTTVNWQGTIMEGTGALTAGTGAFSTNVTFPRRIGEPEGTTSPEELLAGSHGVCFAMVVTGALGRAGGSVDLVHDYFEPVSVLSLAHLMGIDHLVDAPTLIRWFAGLAAGVSNYEDAPRRRPPATRSRRRSRRSSAPSSRRRRRAPTRA